MSKRDGLVLVLWAPRFDELAATVFVTTLRGSGLRVQLVSLSRQLAGGSHGLGLVPDLTLEEALVQADDATCIVLPCGPGDVRRIARDPRVRELLWSACTHNAQVVVRGDLDAVLFDLGLVPPAGGLRPYPFAGDLLPFARDLASALVAVL
jgi:putative intracellular protease/amidase